MISAVKVILPLDVSHGHVGLGVGNRILSADVRAHKPLRAKCRHEASCLSPSSSTDALAVNVKARSLASSSSLDMRHGGLLVPHPERKAQDPRFFVPRAGLQVVCGHLFVNPGRDPRGAPATSSSIPRDSPWTGPGRSSRQCASGWPCTRPPSKKSRGRRRGRTKAQTEMRQVTEETRRGRSQAQVLRHGLQRC